MPKLFIPIALKTAFTSLLTRRLFYGMAISCVVGIGLGAWLEPPKFQFASAATTVTLPQEQPDLWSGDASSVSSRPYDQPAIDASWTQTAAVSPPAAAEPFHLTQADEGQVADTSSRQQGQSIAPAGYDVRAQATERPGADDPKTPPNPLAAPDAGTPGDAAG